MTKTSLTAMQARFIRICRVHFYLVLLFAVQIMIYDAWKLINPESVLQRWLIAAGVLIATTTVWYLGRARTVQEVRIKRLVFSLIAVDIIAASILVYLTRGMASRAVMLYAIPIVTAGVLYSRAAVYAAAFFSIAAYTTTAVAYFVLNFNEGYKIELYGEIGFYSVVMIIVASLVWSLLNTASRD